MKSATSFLRLFFISWETVGLIFPFSVMAYLPSFNAFLFEVVSSDFKWITGGALTITVGLLVFCFVESGEVLSPKGRRERLLDWPEYGRLKATIVVGLFQSFIALLFSITGAALLFKKDSLGIPFLIAGLLQMGITALSLVFALWRTRELLRE